MKINKRQKASIGKFFWDMARIMIFIIVIGNYVSEISIIKNVIMAVLAVAFTILGFISTCSLDDNNPSQ